MRVREQQSSGPQQGVLRALGLGLFTGAADDDCSAIGTYAQAGAQFGYKVLWSAPVTFPMMVSVVYLSGKLGQVTGEGLFSVMRSRTGSAHKDLKSMRKHTRGFIEHLN